jgi:hypothetical protein
MPLLIPILTVLAILVTRGLVCRSF